MSVKIKNMHAIEYLPNFKVSDNFVDDIFKCANFLKPNINILSKQEQELLDTLLYIYVVLKSIIIES